MGEHDFHAELSQMGEKFFSQQLTAADARRLAEINDAIDNPEGMKKWYRIAASLGDQDSIDMMELMRKEGDIP
ncbi:hypothetical protein [Rhodococcus qingshengii]|uniref:hypothetical protein n=1 Tax=Rhodococcus qingshengii TaxID=334542 RepID=UPI0035E0933F